MAPCSIPPLTLPQGYASVYQKRARTDKSALPPTCIQKKILPFSASLCPPSPAFDSKKYRVAEAVGFFMQRRIHLSKVSHTFHMVFHAKSPFSAWKRASYVENPSVVSRCISTFPHMAGLWIFRPFSRRKCGKLEEKHVVFQTKLLQNIFQRGKIAAFHLA